MKWYYEWRLRMVRAKISALEEETRVRLVDDYTAHSRLRVLMRLAEGFQRRLENKSGRPVRPAPKQARKKQESDTPPPTETVTPSPVEEPRVLPETQAAA